MTNSVMDIAPKLGTLLSDLLREQHDLSRRLLGHACCLLVVGRQDVVPRVRQEQAKDAVVLFFAVLFSSSNHHQSISICKPVGKDTGIKAT